MHSSQRSYETLSGLTILHICPLQHVFLIYAVSDTIPKMRHCWSSVMVRFLKCFKWLLKIIWFLKIWSEHVKWRFLQILPQLLEILSNSVISDDILILYEIRVKMSTLRAYSRINNVSDKFFTLNVKFNINFYFDAVECLSRESGSKKIEPTDYINILIKSEWSEITWFFGGRVVWRFCTVMDTFTLQIDMALHKQLPIRIWYIKSLVCCSNKWPSALKWREMTRHPNWVHLPPRRGTAK